MKNGVACSLICANIQRNCGRIRRSSSRSALLLVKPAISRRSHGRSDFDLHLNNGRLLEHFHEGNLTYRSSGIRSKTPDVFVEVSPELAAARGIESGSLVQLTSRHGTLQVRALVTHRIQNGQLFMPMNSTESPVNLLNREPHRSGDSYAGIQRNCGADESPRRERREPVAADQSPLGSTHSPNGC